MNPNNTDKQIVEIMMEDIIPNRFQPRLVFDEEALKELASSIKEHGIIQPLVVRKLGDKYEIIAGERRYKASVMAGLKKVPVIVMNLDDRESAEVAVVENLQRKDLTPLEEAQSYKKLLDKNYLTQEQLAARMGKNQATISNKLRLLALDDKVKEALIQEKISERHARSLLSLKDFNEQRRVLDEIINKKLTVKQTDDMIKEITSNIPVEVPVIATAEPTNKEFSISLPEVNIREPINVSSIIGAPLTPPTPPKAEETEVPIVAPLTPPSPSSPFVNSPKVEEPVATAPTPSNRFIPSFGDEEETIDLFEEINHQPVKMEIPLPVPPREEPKQVDMPMNELMNTRTEIPAVYEEAVQFQPAVPTYSLKEAINEVRKATKNIESQGYVLNLDEYDMENEYQITIHINKNKK